MRKKIRILTLISIVAIASLGVNAVSPIVRLGSVPLRQPAIESAFSMFRDEATKRRWQQEAREFDAAIREIEGITRLDLNTQQGSDEAVNILKRNEGKLAYANSKIATGVLKVEKLKKGVEDEAKKRGGNNKFADEIKQNPGAAKDTPGLEEAGREAEASIQPARETLKRVAAAFEASSKKQSSYVDGLRYTAGNDFFFTKASYITAETCAVDPADSAGAQNYCQSLGINVPTNVCSIIWNVVLLYLGVIVAEPTCVNNCIRNASSRWSTCMSSANALIFPLNVAARATCTNALISRTVGCFLSCD